MNKDLESPLSELRAVHEDLRLIPTEIIVVSDWVQLKCRYGCDNYGKRLGCPPFTPKPPETRAGLSEYRNAVLARFEAKPVPKLTFRNALRALSDLPRQDEKTVVELEKTAFGRLLQGIRHERMPCALCETCVIEEMQKKDQAIFDRIAEMQEQGEQHALFMEACRHRCLQNPSKRRLQATCSQGLQGNGGAVWVDTARLKFLPFFCRVQMRCHIIIIVLFI